MLMSIKTIISLRMKKQLAVSGGLLLAISACSIGQTAWGEFCQKTNRGGVLCIKKENINCEVTHQGIGKLARCKASGVYTDLAGNRSHWNTSHEKNCFSRYINWRTVKEEERDKSSLTCKAASNFFDEKGMVGPTRKEEISANLPSPQNPKGFNFDFNSIDCHSAHEQAQFKDPVRDNVHYTVYTSHDYLIGSEINQSDSTCEIVLGQIPGKIEKRGVIRDVHRRVVRILGEKAYWCA